MPRQKKLRMLVKYITEFLCTCVCLWLSVCFCASLLVRHLPACAATLKQGHVIVLRYQTHEPVDGDDDNADGNGEVEGQNRG